MNEISEQDKKNVLELFKKGQLQQALEACEEKSKNKAPSFFLFHIKGLIYAGLGRYQEAIEIYKLALNLNASSEHAHYNLGLAYRSAGNLSGAIQSFQAAIRLAPNFFMAYNNLGSLYTSTGDYFSAIQNFKSALEIEPSNSLILSNLGAALYHSGALEEAAENLKKAVDLQPELSNAWSNLGSVLKEKGEYDLAIENFLRAFELSPTDQTHIANISTLLHNYPVSCEIKGLEHFLVSLLKQPKFMRPSSLRTLVLNLLKNKQEIQSAITLFQEPSYAINYDEEAAKLSKIDLLIEYMSITPIPDLEIENIFCKLRKGLLLKASQNELSNKSLRFRKALALQCFTNEYIYTVNADEIKLRDEIKARAEVNYRTDPKKFQDDILALASYVALHEINWCEGIKFSSYLKPIKTRLIDEPLREKEIVNEIPSFSSVENEVSLNVKAQYESSPYPRWVNARIISSITSPEQFFLDLKLKTDYPALKRKPLKFVLIAGCGTGQQPLETAAGPYRHLEVTAIDLSKNSLAYAIRNSERYDINNINFFHGDILNLTSLGKEFDVIESVGVLHHMEEPATGWRILTDQLRPGGMIKIGLYSRTAREEITRIREEIVDLNLRANPDSMKIFRKKVIDRGQDNVRFVQDFFSLSMFRDLLFHTQEHLFTIDSIRKQIDNLGLKFCGFVTDRATNEKFRARFESDNAVYELRNWEQFEKENPRTFLGMYQFWCQKF